MINEEAAKDNVGVEDENFTSVEEVVEGSDDKTEDITLQ